MYLVSSRQDCYTIEVGARGSLGCGWLCSKLGLPDLGPPVVPFYPSLGEGSPTKIDYREKGCPCSNLSTGEPSDHGYHPVGCGAYSPWPFWTNGSPSLATTEPRFSGRSECHTLKHVVTAVTARQLDTPTSFRGDLYSSDSCRSSVCIRKWDDNYIYIESIIHLTVHDHVYIV